MNLQEFSEYAIGHSLNPAQAEWLRLVLEGKAGTVLHFHSPRGRNPFWAEYQRTLRDARRWARTFNRRIAEQAHDMKPRSPFARALREHRRARSARRRAIKAGVPPAWGILPNRMPEIVAMQERYNRALRARRPT